MNASTNFNATALIASVLNELDAQDDRLLDIAQDLAAEVAANTGDDVEDILDMLFV